MIYFYKWVRNEKTKAKINKLNFQYQYNNSNADLLMIHIIYIYIIDNRRILLYRLFTTIVHQIDNKSKSFVILNTKKYSPLEIMV